MARYHDTGTICEATKRSCPLGLSEGEHIEADSSAEFEAKLAERMETAAGAFGTSSKANAVGAPEATNVHPWAGERLAAAHSLERAPRKGDWVAFESPWRKGEILSGKVARVGKKSGKPYVVISSDPYEPLETVWPEGDPTNGSKKQAVAVRSAAALNGDSEESWYPKIKGDAEDFRREIETWDHVDFAVLNSRRAALESDERLYWDDIEEERRYQKLWKERYAIADEELARREASGDLSPRRREAPVEAPKPKGPAKGSIASYRAMSDERLRAEYQSQTRDWFDGKGRGGLSKVEKAMGERGLKAEVQLRPWD